ncbi:MAG: hypothetical protein PHI85_05040 [Victivallaceae bacterium]|nr:hypothetical protein [Victivallaceae bacterium]
MSDTLATKHPGGRPRKELDYTLIKKLASLHCTQDEIASVLEVSTRTLLRDEKFCQLYKNGLDNGRIALRRSQFKKALSGDTSMLIWLGKQLLGQKDHIKNDVDVSQPIKLVVDDADLRV